jgi:hypothetical protein
MKEEESDLVIEVYPEDGDWFAPDLPDSRGDGSTAYRPKGWPQNQIAVPFKILDPPRRIQHPPKDPQPE